MDRARVILDDGQEFDAIVVEFSVECDTHSNVGFTLRGVVTGHKLGHKPGPEVTKVIFNNPATVVFWGDGTKTVVKCSENDTFDPEIGLAMAICKKTFGNTGTYNEVFKKWIPEIRERGGAISVDEMRSQLVEYCHPRSCQGCKLNIPASRCGRGAYFDIPKGDDGYMVDGEIREAYNRVFGK